MLKLPAPEQETKLCPFCAEAIRLAARKCRYCGEFLDGWTRQAIQQESARHWDGRSRLVGFDLANCDLVGAVLTDADLTSAVLTGADLTNADLSRANLQKADLRGAILANADLWEANLSDADLCEVDLSYCSIEAANLTRANLCGANLRRAQWRLLDESAIRRAKDVEARAAIGKLLTDDESILLALYQRDEASLRKEISRANFTGARYDATTEWPPDFDPTTAGAILHIETEPSL